MEWTELAIPPLASTAKKQSPFVSVCVSMFAQGGVHKEFTNGVPDQKSISIWLMQATQNHLFPLQDNI